MEKLVQYQLSEHSTGVII